MAKPKSAHEAVTDALEELRLRNDGDFDGLKGEFQAGTSLAVQNIRAYVRDYLLDRHGEKKTRNMLARFSAEKPGSWPALTGDEVALGVLFILGQALNLERNDLLVFLTGSDGSIDPKVRGGGQKGGCRKRDGPNAAPKRKRILKAAERFKNSELASDEKPMADKIAELADCTPRYVRHVLNNQRKSSS